MRTPPSSKTAKSPAHQGRSKPASTGHYPASSCQQNTPTGCDTPRSTTRESRGQGEILSIEERAEVPTGHNEDAILTKDTITIEPDVLEYKLYARCVGPVLVFGVSGGGGRQELIEFHQVDESIAQAAGTTHLGEPYLDE